MSDVLTVPNLVSFLRLLLVPVFLWVLLGAGHPGWAGVVLGVIGATDWVDGFLARRLRQVSEVGKLLDPIADRLAVVVAVVAGLLVGVLPVVFGWAIVVREGLVGVGALYGWRRGAGRLDVRPMGKAATLLLYVAVTGFFLAAGFPARWALVVAWTTGMPGLVLYYAVGALYLGDLRRAIAE